MVSIPQQMHAVQLTGPSELRINPSKEVSKPGPYQLLCKVEAVGLCFSDLKLLKQFSAHPRKSEIHKGIDAKTLQEIPSYVPGEMPTVPGHEAVIRIVEAGPNTKHKVGMRALVQTDYRWLPTDGSNASFGYNFEGGLQEYVLMDERVITSPEGDSMLIPVGEDLGASAIGLIEPWACVENAYVSPERQTVLPGGRMLVVAEDDAEVRGVAGTLSADGKPAEIVFCGSAKSAEALQAQVGCCECSCGSKIKTIASIDAVAKDLFDDIIYFGAKKDMIDKIDQMLAPKGLLNIVLGGRKIGELVPMSIGHAHYGGMRFIGTTGSDASESMKTIPVIPEIRSGDKILIIGAAGPMGLMHVIRDLCQGAKGVEIVATDFDDARLAQLDSKAVPLAKANGLKYESVNPSKDKRELKGSYTVLMVPVAPLVAKAVVDSLPGGIINIFAGLPATTRHEIDMDAYISKRLYFIGTSGSVLRDMFIVLKKVQSGSLDTNVSVGAISGMKGALDGIAAVENRTIAGKIIVYPMLHDMDLTPLADLVKAYPSIGTKMKDDQWNREAEQELLSLLSPEAKEKAV